MFDPWQNQTTENREEPRGDETVPAPGMAPGRLVMGCPHGSAVIGWSGCWGRGGSAWSTWPTTSSCVVRGRQGAPSQADPAAEDAELYLTEARTVASLDHPNIVPVYDVGSTDEFPASSSRSSSTARTSPPAPPVRYTWTQAAELVPTVAEALRSRPQQGLVHRDVKPGNILIDPTGQALRRRFRPGPAGRGPGQGAAVCRHAAYMSPEQARGEGHRVDGRSDIFSLGVVFYECSWATAVSGGDEGGPAWSRSPATSRVRRGRSTSRSPGNWSGSA